MERILAYFGSYKFIFSVCIVAAALVCWLLLRHLIHRFTEKITAASALSGRRQTYLALALNSVRGLLALLALGNLSFWLCDRALTAITPLYRQRIAPRLKKKF